MSQVTEPEPYDMEQDILEMLVVIADCMSSIFNVFRATRRRVTRYVGNAPTPRVFDRIQPFIEKTLDVCIEQLGLLRKS